MENISQLPSEILLENKRRHKDRLVLDVMRELWERIEQIGEFEVDGKKCTVKKFSKPSIQDGQCSFGFDVRIEDYGIDHIEFDVTDSGFGGSI